MKISLIIILLAFGCYANAQAVPNDAKENTVAVPKALTEQEQIQLWTDKGLAAHKIDDLMGAIKWLSKAAEKNHPDAQAMLGYLYLRSDEVAAAVPLIVAAAEQGQVMAIFQLSALHANGTGVEQNNAKAYELLSKAVEQDYLPAYQALALAFEHGDFGLSVDLAQAVHYYQQGSDKGNQTSTYRLIRAYKNGELGFEPNADKVEELKKWLNGNASSDA